MNNARKSAVEAVQADWYDLPAWYDILHARGAAAEVTGLQHIARRFARTHAYRHDPPRVAPTWLEPACGSGRYLRIAATRNIRTIGVDINPAMIKYARAAFDRRGLNGTFLQTDISSFRTRAKADFAFCPINSIRHLMSDKALLDHLQCVHDALKPGGAYAVGVGLTDYETEIPTEDVWTGARGPCRVTQVVQYLPASRKRRIECVVSHLLVRTPTRDRHIDTIYDLRAYDRRQWRSIIRRSPFELAGIVDEQGNDLPPRDGHPDGWTINGYGIYILQKPR